MLEYLFGFLEQFPRVFYSRQVKVETLMLRPQQTCADNERCCEYWRDVRK